MAEIVDFGLQQHKIKMDNSYFDNGLSVVAGDTGRRIEVQLLDTNGLVQDTTGLNLRLNAVVAGKATYTDATLVDATTGKYQLDLSNGMFLAPGNWQFQWQITDSAGKKLHSFAFTGNIGKNISEGSSQATNFYLNLEDLKAMQDDLINGTIDSEVLETNISEKLTNLESEYAPKLTEVTAQLAQKVGGGKLASMPDLGQDIKEALTGGSVAVVGKNTVIEENIVDKQVTPKKTDFFIMSKNLFDKNTLSDGRINEVTGVVYAFDNWVVSGYTTTEEGSEYTFSKAYSHVFFDENREFISGVKVNGVAGYTTTAPAGSRFIRFELHKTASPINTFMFVKGSTLPNNYEAFGTDYIPKEKLERPSNITRSDLADVFMLGTDLPIGTDLNNVKTEGNFTGVANGSYLNLPPGAKTNAAFLIENKALFKGAGRWVIQEYTEFLDTTIKSSRRLDTTGAGTVAWSIINNSNINTTLTGKNIAVFGDSITEFGDYPAKIGEKTGSNIFKFGFGGTRLANHTDSYYDAFSFAKLIDAIISGDFSLQQSKIDDIKNPFSPRFKMAFETLKSTNFNLIDYATIFYGTNDYMGTSAGAVALGSPGDTTRSSFYGALNYVIQRLQTAYPHLKLLFITPTWRENHALLGGGDSDIQPNQNGTYLKEFVEAIKEKTSENHLLCLDFFNTSGINKYNKSIYLADSVHYTTVGYGYIGNKAGSFLNGNY